MLTRVRYTTQVGPFSNPTETYPYYSLPFCPPAEVQHQSHELGELLSGDRKVNTPYDIRFRGESASSHTHMRPDCMPL